MDSITQAVLGAAIGEATLGSKLGNKGAIIGAAIATVPDLDVILYLFYDKFEMLSIHRGFSHSIVFSILGALIIAFVLSKWKWFQNIKFQTLLLSTWLCLFTHMLLDTFTAYGTQLLLPFSNARLGLDCINVVDPLYTIPLSIGLGLSIWKSQSNIRASSYNNWGLIISSIYLLFTLANKQKVRSDIEYILNKQNIAYHSLMTMPVGIANVNWYGVAKGKDNIFMLKHSIYSNNENPIETFPINEAYLSEIDEKVADVMRWFAKGFYTVEKEKDAIRIFNLQVDMRGIVNIGDQKSPTVGYFEVKNLNGKAEFSSGSLPQ